MRPKTSVPLLAVLAAFVLTAEPARAALDLTGTWQGTWSCKDVSNGAVLKPKNTLTMAVTQSGDDVHAFITWNGVSSWDTFQGHVQELTGKPGQGAATIITCATRAGSNEYAEMLSATVKVSPTKAKPANASFKATSTYELAPGTVGGVCKYSLKRISLADPGIAACPVPAVCGNGTIEAPETCEVGNLDGKTCRTQGFAGGALGCAAGCTLDTSGCWATRWVNHGDGTATDNETGLQWELKTDDGTVHDKDNLYTWTAGFFRTEPDGTAFTSFLSALNGGATGVGNCTESGGGFAGHCDWRLPTIGELQGIIDLSAPGCGSGAPCTTIPGFPSTNGYWSSTTSAADPQFAWMALFYDGRLEAPGKNDWSPGYVRAVRGGS